jgi:hypothetical protein
VPIQNQVLEQIVHSHSQASFLDISQTNLVKCIGDSLVLKVSLRGSGPWELVYDVQNGRKTMQNKIQVEASKPIVELPLEKFTRSGTYTVDLVEVRDANGCSTKLNTSPVTIEVLPNRPSVSFQSVKSVYILEGQNARIPITASGRGPFQIGYRNLAISQDILWLEAPKSARYLDVNGSGTYQLASFGDSVCEGIADTTSQVSVMVIPKPSVSFAVSGKKDNRVCLGTQHSFQIDLSGKPPFMVSMSHEFQDKNSKIVSETINQVVETKFLRMAFDTSKPGKHIYRLNSVSDDNYRTPIKYSNDDAAEIYVNEIPSANFVEMKQNVFQCRASMASPFALKLKISGVAPFSLNVEERIDNQHSQYLVREISKDELYNEPGDASFYYDLILTKTPEMGRHDFIINQLIDASGCSAEYETASAPSTFIEVADQARITPFNVGNVCVGDLITFTLQGTPPFSVGYSWNGVNSREDVVEVLDPMFSLWAGSGGQLQITKVCNSGGCCDDTLWKDAALNIVVHDLPQAIVDDGEEFVDDIREGDQF